MYRAVPYIETGTATRATDAIQGGVQVSQFTGAFVQRLCPFRL